MYTYTYMQDIHTKARTSVHSHITYKHKIHICINSYQTLCIPILVHITHRSTATYKHKLIHTNIYTVIPTFILSLLHI